MSGLKYLPKQLIKTQEIQANNNFYQLIQGSGSMCQSDYVFYFSMWLTVLSVHRHEKLG